MNISEYRKRLLSVPMVSELPDTLRERVCMIFLWIGQPVHFTEGESIFIQGDEDENVGCVLVEGEVDVIRAHEESRPVFAPELLGEMQQLEATAQRTATVQSVSDTETLLFSWHDFVGYSGILLTPEEQIVLRDIVRDTAARRRGNGS